MTELYDNGLYNWFQGCNTMFVKTFKLYLPKVEIIKPQIDKWLSSDFLSRISRVIR